MKGDLLLVIQWWVYIFIIGLIFFPFTQKIFKSFFDRGYLFSKTIGLAVSSCAVWLLSSLRIAPFGRITISFVLILAFIIILIFSRGYKSLIRFIKEKTAIYILEEIMFLALLIFWSYIRGIQPDIYGLEKFMDFGFVNSILRSKYMPPQDMWFAGQKINYYYYGHYVCAYLTKLSGIDSAYTYNLMIALLFAFAFSLTFSIAGNCIYLIGKQKSSKVIAAGLISAVLLTLGGNLHTIIYAHILPSAKEAGIYKGEIKNYFYAEATRYIGYNPETDDKTIHEFPIYSFVVSDLHAHVSDIPFVLTFLAFMLSFVYCRADLRKIWFIIPFLLSLMNMTNTWDYIIYLTVALFVYVLIRMWDGLSIRAIIGALFDTVKTFAVSQLICLPYTINFKNMTGGVGFVHARTPLYQLLVLWGYQLFLTAAFIIFLVKYKKKTEKIGSTFLGWQISDMYILILLVSAVGLVIIPEIVYVIDIYGSTYHRANTMFKLTYQSFIMFGAAAGYIVIRILSSIKRNGARVLLGAVFTVVLICPAIYPFEAIKGYYGNIGLQNYKGLYGMNFLKKMYPDDYKAVEWLNQNVKGQPVVLEANGDSYTEYNRISMATGLPTIQGWFVHEWLWRGGSQYPTARAEEVAMIYESDDVGITSILLDKYNVEYIVVGQLERQKFKNLNYDKLLEIGTVVLDLPQTSIIKVK